MFIDHFYNGRGRTLTLAEVGHKKLVFEQFAYYDRRGDDDIVGALNRFTHSIAASARRQVSGPVRADFNSSYRFAFSDPPQFRTFVHGDARMDGTFLGTVRREGDMLVIEGTTEIVFEDKFIDPLGIRQAITGSSEGSLGRYDPSELGGTPFTIKDSWSVDFTARIFLDETKSYYPSRESEPASRP